jgi:hypothetical protein
MMGGVSLWHLLIFLALMFLYIFPATRIVQKAGYSGWWAVLLMVPFVNIAMLWVFAFAPWPNLRQLPAA